MLLKKKHDSLFYNLTNCAVHSYGHLTPSPNTSSMRWLLKHLKDINKKY